MPSFSDDRGLAQLFELATPDLYQRNAFRILGLRVETETGDARRQKKKLKRRKALGLGAKPSGSILPLSGSVGPSELQQAQDRIQDPVSRLLDEFFWFWPHEDATAAEKNAEKEDDDEAAPPEDEALRKLEENQSGEAARIFSERESRGSAAAIHNLAVLHHLTALDLELRSQSETLSEADRAARDKAWTECYPRWQKLLDDPATWSRVRERISELDDPRLTHDLVSQIRESLEEVVLLISARLAVRAAEQNDAAGALRHVHLMRNHGLSDSRASDALRRCLWPIEQRIRNAANRIDGQSDVEPQAGLRLSEELLAETLPPLKLIDQMLPAGDQMREGLHDDVAKFSLRSLIAYGNKTEDWRSLKPVMSRLLSELSPSGAMRERLEESLRVVTENLKFNLCYYCADHTAATSCEYEVPMYGDVQTTWTGYKTYRVTWRHLTVKVPRCPRCLADHNASDNAYALGGVAGFAVSAIAAIIGFAIWQPKESEMGIQYLFAAIACLVGATILTWIGAEIGYVVGRNQLAYEQKAVGDYEAYSSISQLRSEGWSYGSEPPS